MGCGASSANGGVVALPPRPPGPTGPPTVPSPQASDRTSTSMPPPRLENQENPATAAVELARLRAENRRLEDLIGNAIIIDRSAPHEAKLAQLQVELRVLQPYGPPVGHGDPVMDNEPLRPQTANFRAQAAIITALEKNLDSAREEVEQLRLRLERAVQRARVGSAQARAEASLAAIEVKETAAVLKTQNEELQRQLRDVQAQAQQARTGANTDVLDAEHLTDSRAQLIVDLSAQLCEVNDELAEANATIVRLQHQNNVSNVCKAINAHDSAIEDDLTV